MPMSLVPAPCKGLPFVGHARKVAYASSDQHRAKVYEVFGHGIGVHRIMNSMLSCKVTVYVPRGMSASNGSDMGPPG